MLKLNIFKKTKEDIIIQVSENKFIQVCNKIPEFTNWTKIDHQMKLE